MNGRIIEIAEDGRYLSADRGFMVVRDKDGEVGRVPLDDIGVVVINAHGATYTNNLIVSLADRGVGLVICGANHRPQAWLWPIAARHDQSGRMRAQVEATKPLSKRLWKLLVRAKIAQQAAVLAALGRSSVLVSALRHQVNSGDPENIEAQAARRYWPLLLGENFRRDRAAGGANAMLNYGYTVLRAAAARSICAAGLHPSIGLSHKSDDFPLADDLMEPFRPIVDLCVVRLLVAGKAEVDSEAKRSLALVTSHDMRTDRGTTPLSACLDRLAISLARSFETGRALLDLPLAPLPLDLADSAAKEPDEADEDGV
jgi:CRISPR-associated protein Cas1